jgi:hypothetical protein
VAAKSLDPGDVKYALNFTLRPKAMKLRTKAGEPKSDRKSVV